MEFDKKIQNEFSIQLRSFIWLDDFEVFLEELMAKIYLEVHRGKIKQSQYEYIKETIIKLRASPKP